MSPSVRRRRRPRVRSISFHTLWWLLRREVVLRVVYPHAGHPEADWTPARQGILFDWRRHERSARKLLAGDPARNMYPR